jgi:HK97 gp10 family phage protein
MAKCEIRFPTEFEEKLSKLGSRTDEIVPKVLEAGGEVVLEKVRSNLSSVLSGDSTGELARSLGLSPAKPKRDGSGHDIKVGFAEPRSDGKSNAFIANVLEYGRVGQPPRPFLKPAKTKSKQPALEAMQAKFESEVENI